MLLYHMYIWKEAVPYSSFLAGTNTRLTRLSLDMLLPGPTSLDQLELFIASNGEYLDVSYKPPVTYLSASRTMARVADLQGISEAQTQTAMPKMAITARVQAHETVLDEIREKQGKIDFRVKLAV